jgi:SP family myo-inositol transporter-like MFS transporter 13
VRRICEDCITNEACGYCYDENDSGFSTCLLVSDGDEELYSSYGACHVNATGEEGRSINWSHGFCPTDYSWMAVLGLALFVLSFAPGESGRN